MNIWKNNIEELEKNLKEYNELEGISEADQEEMKNKEKYIDSNIREKLKSTENKISFSDDVKALYNFMKSGKVSITKKIIAIMALLYFIIPVDSIPDIAPIIGYLDDLGVIVVALKFLNKELSPFYEND